MWLLQFRRFQTRIFRAFELFRQLEITAKVSNWNSVKFRIPRLCFEYSVEKGNVSGGRERITRGGGEEMFQRISLFKYNILGRPGFKLELIKNSCEVCFCAANASATSHPSASLWNSSHSYIRNKDYDTVELLSEISKPGIFSIEFSSARPVNSRSRENKVERPVRRGSGSFSAS